MKLPKSQKKHTFWEISMLFLVCFIFIFNLQKKCIYETCDGFTCVLKQKSSIFTCVLKQEVSNFTCVLKQLFSKIFA